MDTSNSTSTSSHTPYGQAQDGHGLGLSTQPTPIITNPSPNSATPSYPSTHTQHPLHPSHIVSTLKGHHDHDHENENENDPTSKPKSTGINPIAGGAPIQPTTGQNAGSGTAGGIHPQEHPFPHRSGTNNSHASNRSNPNDGPNSRSPTQVFKRMTTGLFTPEKEVKKQPGFWRSWRNLLMGSWINVLLVFIPISWALHFAIDNDTVIFVMCFLAILPLASLLGFATETITLYTSQTIGGLLNATLGNAVELIVAVIALIKCELQVVQSSLIGSILSNLLLVCGCCFLAGGARFAEQEFKTTASQLNSSLLLMAVIAVLIPSAFHFSITTTSDGAGTSLTSEEEKRDILAMSHGVAIILLILYLGYLLFQLFSHADLYEDDKNATKGTPYPEAVTSYPSRVKDKISRRKLRSSMDNNDADRSSHGSGSGSILSSPIGTTGDTRYAMAHIHGTSAVLERRKGMRIDDEGRILSWGPRGPPPGMDVEKAEVREEEEEEEPEMSWLVALLAMVLVAVLVGVTAEFLVDSINGLVESNPSLSAEWVGLILLPIVGNAAEHWSAVLGAVKDKLDLSIAIAVGSSIQIALFVIPFIVVLGWIIGKPLLMLFDPFESVTLFLAVIIVNQALADGKTNWMEGLTLFLVYILIAVSFWYYPGSETANLIGQAGCS